MSKGSVTEFMVLSSGKSITSEHRLLTFERVSLVSVTYKQLTVHLEEASFFSVFQPLLPGTTAELDSGQRQCLSPLCLHF